MRRLAPASFAVALLCGAPAGAMTPQEQADHEALRTLRRAYEQAVNEQRLDLLAPHLHPEFTGVMVTGETVVGIEGMRRYWARIQELMGPGGRYTVTVEPDLSRLMGDVALSTGTTKDVVRTDRGEYHFGSAWTAVSRKVDGQWKVLRVQGSMDPVTNPFVKTFLKRTALTSGGGGAAAGILLGLAGGWVAARRRKPSA
jgi:ketosteroid isomerase-like protein